MLLYLITEFLTDGRLIRIVGQENDRYVPLIRDPHVIDYDVIVDDAPSSPSQKELVWNSMVQMLPLIQNMQPPPQVILALLDYSPLPSSVVAKIKQGLADAAGNAQPTPSPMELVMQEKQLDIQANAQKNAANLDFKQTDHQLDLRHTEAKANIDLQARIAEENAKRVSLEHAHRLTIADREHEAGLKAAQRRAEMEQEKADRAEERLNATKEVGEATGTHLTKGIKDIADVHMKALERLHQHSADMQKRHSAEMKEQAKRHSEQMDALMKEVRRPRKRTLVRGKDGRATHAIEEAA
jgi:hypothetical protein